MQITKEKLQARIQQLQIDFAEAERKKNEIMGALQECTTIMKVIDAPEPPIEVIK
jgi:hypothetical protein